MGGAAYGRLPSDPPRLSVLVAARGYVLPYMLRLLLSCLEYPRDRFEVVVVVDEGDWETLRACEGLDLVRAVFVSDPMGKPRALNVGLRAAGGELVMLMDADSVVEGRGALEMFRLMGGSDVAGVAAIPYPLNLSEGVLPFFFGIEARFWEVLSLAKDALGLFVQAPGSLSLLRCSWIERVG